MKQSTRWFLFILCSIGGLLLAGCVLTPEGFGPLQTVRGSGQMVTQEMAITGFERVEMHNAFEVEIRQGAAFAVVIRVDEAVAPRLRVVKEGDTLQIGLAPGLRIVGSAALTAQVTMPRLAGVSASGASRVVLAGFASTAALDLEASGAAEMSGEIDAGDTRLRASGASRVSLAGEGGRAMIRASGASRVDLAGFPVAEAAVEASGASNVTVQTNGALDVEASGGSRVLYLGDPILGNIETSGGATVGRR